MLSTLTTGVKDGKPVGKIERNTRKIGLYEILFCVSGGKSRTIAHYFGAAQSFLAVLLVAMPIFAASALLVGAGKPAPTKSWRR
ncbi:hypothetical protein ACW9IK_03600 [Pseudomonas gingeri]